jgi:hypothetical protein
MHTKTISACKQKPSSSWIPRVPGSLGSVSGLQLEPPIFPPFSRAPKPFALSQPVSWKHLATPFPHASQEKNKKVTSDRQCPEKAGHIADITEISFLYLQLCSLFFGSILQRPFRGGK